MESRGKEMNYKNVILIALALCMCFVLPVAAVSAYYESKYVPTNNEIPSDGCGQLIITTLTKHALIGAEFTLNRVDPGSFTFTNGQLIDKIQYDALVKQGEPYEFALDHNGYWEDRIAPGTFAILKPDDNGGQPAYAIVTVTKGYTSTVVFKGHGVSSAIGIKRMSVVTNIDGCDVYLNGLKMVKDELINVPESTKTVCKRVKVIDQPYVPAVPGIPAVMGEGPAIIDQPYVPAVPAGYEAGHVHAKKTHGNSQHDFDYNGDKYQIVGDSSETAFIVTSHTNVRLAQMIPAKPAIPETHHHNQIVITPAVPAVPAIQERSHYETQCKEVIVPAYSYWTYKLEGRVTIKSIDTVITNPNNIRLTGNVNVVVAYTVDHNFGHWFDTDTDLEDKTQTFTGTFTSVPQGSTFYDGNIVFADRINDAIIDDEHFPYVESSSITTVLPLGYYFLN